MCHCLHCLLNPFRVYNFTCYTYCALLQRVDEMTGGVVPAAACSEAGMVTSRLAREDRNRRHTGTTDTRHTAEDRFNQHL